MSTKKLRLSDHYGTVYKEGNIYTLKFERHLQHPVKRVWDAITKPDQLALWLSPNIEKPGTEIDLKTGGRIKLQYMMALPEGTITRVQHEKLLEITWSEEHITTWQLFEEGKNACRLVFTETYDESFVLPAATGNHAYLDMLELVLNGHEVPGNIIETWNEVSAEASAKYETLLKN